MTTTVIARRYAQALLMLALERDTLDEYQGQLEFMLQLLATQETLRVGLEMPRLEPEQKKQLLRSYLKGQVSGAPADFLYLIIDKRREAYLTEMIRAFIRYADKARNIIEAEVRSAVTLTDQDFRALKKRLSRATGKNVRLNAVVDPSLLGGIVVKVGEHVLDGSVIKRLSLMKKHLEEF